MDTTLEVRHLSVKVGNDLLLNDVNMLIPSGEVHALLGPNGSGKTTLLMTIMGYPSYNVVEGQILFGGQDITHLDSTERARLGIRISQQRPPTIAGVKQRQLLDYMVGGDAMAKPEVARLVEMTGMTSFLDRDLNAGLSGGEIKRSELLHLLVADPSFVMLDEPESGVDVGSMKIVGQLINKLFTRDTEHPALRRTGLVITHTGQILDYIEADKGHVMLGTTIACSGNPRIILAEAGESGYEACVRCLAEGACR